MSDPALPNKPRTVILISGRGSNMLRLVQAAQEGRCHIDPVAAISNRPQAQGLAAAEKLGLDTQRLDHTQFDSREQFDDALAEVIDAYQPDLIILAGFMRILTEAFVARYEGRMLNIHPSLLPLYPGLNTHQRALDAGDTEHGATVHFVTATLDSGPLIVQSEVPIESNDSSDTLAQRVLDTEYPIYTLAADWFGRGWVSMQAGKVTLFEQTLLSPIKYRNGQLYGADAPCLEKLNLSLAPQS